MPDHTMPEPPERPLKLVPLADPGRVVERLLAPRVRLHIAFHPIAGLRRAEAVGYEAVLGLPGEPPRAPRAWSRDVHLTNVGPVEGTLLAAALSALEQLPGASFLAVNLSAPGLLSREVQEAFASAPSLARLVVVVTDDADNADSREVGRVLDRLRDRGAALGVDETGSGYNALRHVLRLRPDYVRVGADFVDDVDRDQAKAAVMESVCHLAANIDASVIASAVASAIQLEALVRIGVPLAQGPFFGESLEEMVPLARPAAEAIRDATPAPAPEETVADLVEAQPAVAWAAPLEHLADTFLDDPRHDMLVLVDERSRPLALAERAALLRGEPYERPVTRISPSSPLKAVARRAAGRPVMERFHPLVVCDRRGVYLGIVRIEQLLDALAR